MVSSHLSIEGLLRQLNQLARTAPRDQHVPIEAEDVQGLVFRGYGGLKHASYPLLRIKDGAAADARAWLRALEPRIARGRQESRDVAIQIAFTYPGLAQLRLAPELLAGFSREFREGMTTDHRRRLLGDDDATNHPDYWRWGGPKNAAVHIALVLLARSADRLSQLHGELAAAWTAAGLEEVNLLETGELRDTEHFGFVDGISQPAIEGYHQSSSPLHKLKAGEFLLGYPNEYGLFTDRPMAAPSLDPRGILPLDSEQSPRRDFGKNGTYLVFRQVRQNVPAFRNTLDELTRNPNGTPNREARDRLAAQMVGRWPSGASLVLSPERDDVTQAKANEFRYHAEDRLGLKCPIGSHVRRANPRDALDPLPGTETSLAVNRHHRLIRRGRAYGPPLPEGAVDDADRGLILIFVNAMIARQFEFVQHSWINDPHFNGLHNDSDPIVGSSTKNEFAAPGEPIGRRCTGLPRFVTVTGGGYFFLPGIRALRYLAEVTP
jgi:Dyp-type peroxidase family